MPTATEGEGRLCQRPLARLARTGVSLTGDTRLANYRASWRNKSGALDVRYSTPKRGGQVHAADDVRIGACRRHSELPTRSPTVPANDITIELYDPRGALEAHGDTAPSPEQFV
jgi:hypothetical protein